MTTTTAEMMEDGDEEKETGCQTDHHHLILSEKNNLRFLSRTFLPKYEQRSSFPVVLCKKKSCSAGVHFGLCFRLRRDAPSFKNFKKVKPREEEGELHASNLAAPYKMLSLFLKNLNDDRFLFTLL